MRTATSRTPLGRAFEPSSTLNVLGSGSNKLQDKHNKLKLNSSDLVEACSSGSLEEVEKLLAAGVPANAEDSCGEPAICSATLSGHSAVLRVLLSYGASVLQSTTFKETPLHLAARTGSVECLTVLLDHARTTEVVAEAVATKNYMGAECLHVASEKGHTEACRLLVEAGASMEEEDHSGRCPLHLAVYWGHEACVQELLELGAEPQLRAEGGKGESALEMAERGSHSELRLVMMGHLLRLAQARAEAAEAALSQERERGAAAEERSAAAEAECAQLRDVSSRQLGRVAALEERGRELEAAGRRAEAEAARLHAQHRDTFACAEAATRRAEEMERELRAARREGAEAQHALEVQRAVGKEVTAEAQAERERASTLAATLRRLQDSLQVEQAAVAEAREQAEAGEAAAAATAAREEKVRQEKEDAEAAHKWELERRLHWEAAAGHLETRCRSALSAQDALKQRMSAMLRESEKLWQAQMEAMRAELATATREPTEHATPSPMAEARRRVSPLTASGGNVRRVSPLLSSAEALKASTDGMDPRAASTSMLQMLDDTCSLTASLTSELSEAVSRLD